MLQMLQEKWSLRSRNGSRRTNKGNIFMDNVDAEPKATKVENRNERHVAVLKAEKEEPEYALNEGKMLTHKLKLESTELKLTPLTCTRYLSAAFGGFKEPQRYVVTQ